MLGYIKNNSMKKLLLVILFLPLMSLGQSFELTYGQSMRMIGKGEGQDATINPYADEEYSFALIENIGSVEFQVRLELIEKDVKQFLIKPSDKVVIKLNRKTVLYLDALTLEKAEANIKYTINKNELPPSPPPIQSHKQ